MSRAARAALVVFAAGVAAQAAISVNVAPPVIEKVARPQSTITDVLLFRNSGDAPLEVSVSFSDFAVESDGSVHEKPPGLDKSSVLPYVRISPLRAHVEPGQETTFRYTIAVPASFTQLRTMIMFAGTPQVRAAANQVVIAPRVGIPLYVESTSAKPAHLEVANLEWKRPAGAKDTIALNLSVRNTGERNIRPAGTVRVRSAGGFDHTFAFNEGREPVLPGQKRNWDLLFGPVPGGELSVSLRFATSFRDTFRRDSRIPAAP